MSYCLLLKSANMKSMSPETNTWLHKEQSAPPSVNNWIFNSKSLYISYLNDDENRYSSLRLNYRMKPNLKMSDDRDEKLQIGHWKVNFKQSVRWKALRVEYQTEISICCRTIRSKLYERRGRSWLSRHPLNAINLSICSVINLHKYVMEVSSFQIPNLPSVIPVSVKLSKSYLFTAGHRNFKGSFLILSKCFFFFNFIHFHCL